MANFKERLLMLRTEKGISQAKLGKVLDVSRWSIYNYETGKNYPDYNGLITLADFFNVSLDYLVGRSDVREVAR